METYNPGPERGIVIVWTILNDDVVNDLRAFDDFDENLKDAIEILLEYLSDTNKEIFEIGNHYVVTEDEICIAVYEDELEITTFQP
jgi:hypothetical protein